MTDRPRAVGSVWSEDAPPPGSADFAIASEGWSSEPVPVDGTSAVPPGRVAARRAWQIAGLSLFLGAATLAVALSTPLRFAYPASSWRVALETGIAVTALLSTCLLLGRFGPGIRADRLYLAAALAAIAATNLVLATVHTLEQGAIPHVLLHTGTLSGAAFLALAAFVPGLCTGSRGRTAVCVLATSVLVLAGSYGVAQSTLSAPEPLLGVAKLDGDRPYLERSLADLVLHLAAAAIFGLAVVGFVRRFRRSRDELLPWLAAGAVSVAAAGVAYFLFPGRASSVHVGDLLRWVFFVLVLVGVARWVRSYWRELATIAVTDERRRIARELHDGVAQELALIQRRTPRFAVRPEAAVAREITVAAGRALDELRQAIDALSGPRDESLDLALAREARHVTAGTGVALSLDLAQGVKVQPDVRENLVRIAREAMTNAARHGSAATIRVELAPGHPLRMRVVDDGVGFEPARGAPRGAFGLMSMRERASAIGADLTLCSRPGTGTEVRVRFP
jgi:signal transduction histidine kinase